MLNVIIKGCSLTLLPKCIIFLYYSFLGKIFRIFGSMCVIICLCNFHINIIYIDMLIELFASMFLSLLILLSLIRIVYGFCIISYRYNININSWDVCIYIIVLVKIIIIFLLNILGFSILEGFVEILKYIYDIRSDLYFFYKRILKIFL